MWKQNFLLGQSILLACRGDLPCGSHAAATPQVWAMHIAKEHLVVDTVQDMKKKQSSQAGLTYRRHLFSCYNSPRGQGLSVSCLVG